MSIEVDPLTAFVEVDVSGDVVEVEVVGQGEKGDPGGGAFDGDASDVPYTPATEGDWDPVPAQVAEALDELAGREVGGGAVDSVNGETGAVVLDAADVGAVDVALVGAADGVAELDSGGLVPSSQLPSYVDDVIEAANFAALPGTGATGKIYVTLDNNLTFRWSGSAYVEVSASLALGETSSTAYRGDRGKTAFDHSQVTTGNPHGTTAADVGVDASGFNGNLTTSDDTVQEIAQKLDDLSVGGGAVATDAIWDAKGDMAVGTGADTAARLAVGANGTVLTADSAEAAGVKWAAAGGTSTIISEQTLGVDAASVTFSSLSAYKEFWFTMEARSTTASGTAVVQMQLNGDTGANYGSTREAWYDTSEDTKAGGSTMTSVGLALIPGTNTNSNRSGQVNAKVSSRTGRFATVDATFAANVSNLASAYGGRASGLWRDATAISSITVSLSAGNFVSGSYFRLEGRA